MERLTLSSSMAIGKFGRGAGEVFHDVIINGDNVTFRDDNIYHDLTIKAGNTIYIILGTPCQPLKAINGIQTNISSELASITFKNATPFAPIPEHNLYIH